MNACLQHSFITENRTPNSNVIMELIQRTKDVVSELDQFQYRRMRKLMYLDDKEARLAGVESSTNEEVGCEVDELFIADPRTEAAMLTDAAELISQSSDPSRSGTMERANARQSADNRTLISVGGATSDGREGSVASAGRGSMSFVDTETPSTSTSQSISRNQSMNGTGERQAMTTLAEEAQDKINTLRWSKFSTLRTTKVISREVEEYKRDDNIYEQMVGYKRLRQQHHKELKQLEERCKVEGATLQQKQDKEYDQLLITCQKEQQKVRTQVQVEMEKQRRENEEAMRKFRKQKLLSHEHQYKSFVSCQKKEYKYNKDRTKAVRPLSYSVLIGACN